MVKDPTQTAIAAPMSFAGSTERTLNLLWRDRPTALKASVSWWAIPIILMFWWLTILIWYLIFGLLLVPYRLIRRGSRKRKREAAMHEQTLTAIREANQQQPPSNQS